MISIFLMKYMSKPLIDEMEGIAAGICMSLGNSCNVTEWEREIKTVNMLPELIRMV